MRRVKRRSREQNKNRENMFGCLGFLVTATGGAVISGYINDAVGVYDTWPTAIKHGLDGIVTATVMFGTGMAGAAGSIRVGKYGIRETLNDVKQGLKNIPKRYTEFLSRLKNKNKIRFATGVTGGVIAAAGAVYFSESTADLHPIVQYSLDTALGIAGWTIGLGGGWLLSKPIDNVYERIKSRTKKKTRKEGLEATIAELTSGNQEAVDNLLETIRKKREVAERLITACEAKGGKKRSEILTIVTRLEELRGYVNSYNAVRRGLNAELNHQVSETFRWVKSTSEKYQGKIAKKKS